MFLFSSIIGLLIGTLIAFNVIIGDLVPSIFQNLSGVQVKGVIYIYVIGRLGGPYREKL